MGTEEAGDTVKQTCEPGWASKKRNKGRKEEDKLFSTPECPRPSKKKRVISKGKSKRGILSYFKTSPLASTSREEVSKVVVTYRDRLARFGVELLERMFRLHGTQLVVVSHQQVPADSNQELADDLLAVCNLFVAKNNASSTCVASMERSW